MRDLDVLQHADRVGQDDEIERAVFDLGEPGLEVVLDHVHAVAHAGNDVRRADLHAIALHAAGLRHVRVDVVGGAALVAAGLATNLLALGSPPTHGRYDVRLLRVLNEKAIPVEAVVNCLCPLAGQIHVGLNHCPHSTRRK